MMRSLLQLQGEEVLPLLSPMLVPHPPLAAQRRRVVKEACDAQLPELEEEEVGGSEQGSSDEEEDAEGSQVGYKALGTCCGSGLLVVQNEGSGSEPVCHGAKAGTRHELMGV